VDDPVQIDALLDLAARGLGRFETLGMRGAARCTPAEITAMALTLKQLGLKPILPGMPGPGTAEFLPDLKIGDPPT